MGSRIRRNSQPEAIHQHHARHLRPEAGQRSARQEKQHLQQPTGFDRGEINHPGRSPPRDGLRRDVAEDPEVGASVFHGGHVREATCPCSTGGSDSDDEGLYGGSGESYGSSEEV